MTQTYRHRSGDGPVNHDLVRALLIGLVVMIGMASFFLTSSGGALYALAAVPLFIPVVATALTLRRSDRSMDSRGAVARVVPDARIQRRTYSQFSPVEVSSQLALRRNSSALTRRQIDDALAWLKAGTARREHDWQVRDIDEFESYEDFRYEIERRLAEWNEVVVEEMDARVPEVAGYGVTVRGSLPTRYGTG